MLGPSKPEGSQEHHTRLGHGSQATGLRKHEAPACFVGELMKGASGSPSCAGEPWSFWIPAQGVLWGF